MVGDPFWKRSGFWTAIIGTIPVIYGWVETGSLSLESITYAVGLWGTFFTAKVVRPSNSNHVVQLMLDKQQVEIKALKRVNEGQR